MSGTFYSQVFPDLTLTAGRHYCNCMSKLLLMTGTKMIYVSTFSSATVMVKMWPDLNLVQFRK